MSFHPLRRGLCGFSSVDSRVTLFLLNLRMIRLISSVGQFLTFTYKRTSGFGSLTKFKTVSIPREIGTPELEIWSSSWKEFQSSDSSFGNQTKFKVKPIQNQMTLGSSHFFLIFKKFRILIPVPTGSGSSSSYSSTGSGFRPVPVLEPDPKSDSVLVWFWFWFDFY